MDVALRDYLEKMIAEADRRYEQRFRQNEVAVAKAEEAMNARLDSMNEFRDALKDQAARMATREELERVEHTAEEKAPKEELKQLERRIDGLATKDALEQVTTSVGNLQLAKAKQDGGLVVLCVGASLLVSLLVAVIVPVIMRRLG